MSNLRDELLREIEASIRRRMLWDGSYQVLRVALTVVIAACGTLTALASRTEAEWVASPEALLTYGLVSAVAAVINQVVNPGEKHVYHKSIKKCLQYVRGEVKFGEMPVQEAQRLRAIAVTHPEVILGNLKAAAGSGPQMRAPSE